MTVRWREGTGTIDCRACGYGGIAPIVLEFEDPGSPEPGLGRRCPSCGSIALLDEILDSDPDDASVDNYIEAGAGLGVIASLVDALGPGEGRTLLDVGCGFGFGPDYAAHARGWRVTGVEPSHAGVRGARELGLEIVSGYFDDHFLPGRVWDAQLSSEVLEHVPDPRAFLRALRRRLSDDGHLILTTPDAAVVDPASPLSDVTAVVSAGFHFSLYSETALRSLLRDAGFAAVSVTRTGLSHQVVASASRALPTRRSEEARERRILYLRDRAAVTKGALAVGFASRALREDVAAGDLVAARRDVVVTARAFRRQHHVDIRRPRSVRRFLDSGATSGALGGVLFALGMIELIDGDPALAAERFDESIRAVTAWRTMVAASDLDSLDILHQARYHRVLALVRSDPRSAGIAAEEFSASYSETPTENRHTAAELSRIYVDLVMSGAAAAAVPIEPVVAKWALRLATSNENVESVVGRDALYALGVAALDSERQTDARRHLTAALRYSQSGHTPSLDLAAAARAALARTTDRTIVPVRLDYALDIYWVDAGGMFLDGWAHLDGEPGETLAVESEGERYIARRHRREDLLAHWPASADVESSGFRVYLPGPPSRRVDLVLTHEGVDYVTTIALPEEQLPVGPGVPTLTEAIEQIVVLCADAHGPVLALGARRSESEATPFANALFPGREVVGLDIHPGEGVDIVGDAHRLHEIVEHGHFEVILSSSLLEHVAAPWLVAAEIATVLPLGGLAVHIAPWVWPTHSQPNDFWRFSEEGLRTLFGAELGWEVVGSGSCAGATIIPSDDWRRDNPDIATHLTPTTSWIVARKVDDRARGVRWPYEPEAGGVFARRYPVDGIDRAPREPV